MTASSRVSTTKKLKIAIIGSGPSGVAASNILLNKHDCQVDMIDVGLEMDARTFEFKESAKNTKRDIFLDQLENKRAQLDKKNKSSVPQKLLFGSDFIYHRIAQVKAKIDDTIKLNITFAKGGLGRIWGANISSIFQNDIEEWPISEKSLTPYFKQLEHIVPISSEKDALGERFHYQPKAKYSFPLTSSSQKILDVSLKNEETLKNAGIYLGRAKVVEETDGKTDDIDQIEETAELDTKEEDSEPAILCENCSKDLTLLLSVTDVNFCPDCGNKLN